VAQPQPRQQLPAPVMKILLGHELGRQRKDAGLTQDDAAAVLHCTQQKIRLHQERRRGAYAEDLHKESQHKVKRGGFRSRFRQHMRLLVDLEPTCQRYYIYRAMVVPGLLQTEDYMRILFRSWRPSLSQDQIDRDAAARLAKQRILDNTEQRFWIILDEAALRRTAGSEAVMKEQIMQLVETIDRPNVELQVVPFDAGYYMGQAHDYSIFGYNTQPPVDIVYLEHHDGGEYVDDLRRTSTYQTLWEQQKAAAMGPEQTRRFLLGLVRSS
jgi:uncharacterized protein DUF5753